RTRPPSAVRSPWSVARAQPSYFGGIDCALLKLARLRTTDEEDGRLDRHFRLLVPRLGGGLLPPGAAPREDAGALLPVVPPGRAELHLLPAADARHAGEAGGQDAAGLPVPGEAAPDGQPRGEPARPGWVPPRRRGAGGPAPTGRPALPAAPVDAPHAQGPRLARDAGPGAGRPAPGGGVAPPRLGGAAGAGVAPRPGPGPGVGGRARAAGAVPARLGAVEPARVRAPALAEQREVVSGRQGALRLPLPRRRARRVGRG